MAHFIGYLQGSRGPASRLGTPKSGISASAQGWHIGGDVKCRVNDEGKDVVSFRVHGGSSGNEDVWLAIVKRNAQGTIEITINKELAKTRNVVVVSYE